LPGFRFRGAPFLAKYRPWEGYREAGSLNGQVNLFGFVVDHTFLTSLLAQSPTVQLRSSRSEPEESRNRIRHRKVPIPAAGERISIHGRNLIELYYP
jgi:hypothetical protein